MKFKSLKFKSLKFKSLRPDAAFTRFVLSWSAGLLFVGVRVSAEAQQTPRYTPVAPPANKQTTPTPSIKYNKSLLQGVQEKVLKDRETLQRQLTTAVQEEKLLQKRADTLHKEVAKAQNGAAPSLRLEKMRQLHETQAKLTDKQVFILKQKQLLEQNASTMRSLSSSLSQNQPGVLIPAPELDAGSRSLLFTPTDKAKLVKRNLLFTPEDQKRVKFLPKSDGRTVKP